MNNIKTPRRRARSLALQAIYQWQFNHEPMSNLEAQFLEEANPKKIDVEFFLDIVRGTITNLAAIDKALEGVLDRKLESLDQVELAVLRIACYELLFRIDVPYKVVINEALELTKLFGSIEGFKYVNGVLDKIAISTRSPEMINK
ncbi:MAG: transcription antitermination factor NusB [Gammaproteobacteria bacterium]|nr:transcription antitermination factor NusB [Gammaproteobacteria bacterium]